MKKRVLGNSGIEVSSMGLGCMGLSHAYGAPLEKKESIRLIRKALDLGYTFFDTAEVYGTEDDPHTNETLVGEALKDCRDKVVIATKFGIRFDTDSNVTPHPLIADASPDKIRSSVEGSLRRLNTDYIDLYYQHRVDPSIPPEEVAGVMSRLIEEGKIRSWGISEVGDDYLRRANAVCPVSAVENRYSMMAKHYETLFPVLEELNIAFVAFSPLANGFLTGKYGKGTVFDKKYDYRSAMPQFTDDAVDKNRVLMDLIEKMAKEKNATSAQLSLAWMMCKKPWIIPIPGTRNVDRLEENAGTDNIELTTDEVAMLDKTLDSIPMSNVFGGSVVVKK